MSDMRGIEDNERKGIVGKSIARKSIIASGCTVNVAPFESFVGATVRMSRYKASEWCLSNQNMRPPQQTSSTRLFGGTSIRCEFDFSHSQFVSLKDEAIGHRAK